MGKTNQIKDWDKTFEKYSDEETKEIKHLPMSISEIMDSYRRSHKSKAEKLKILAELNGCQKELIQLIVDREINGKGRPVKEDKKVETTNKVVRKETKVEDKALKKAETKKKREYVSSLVYYTIEREHKAVQERISTLKSQLESAQKALVDFTDFLETHTDKY